MPLAAELAGHQPVHVVDLPRFGLSGDPGRVLDVIEHADHLADWLNAADLPSVAMLGTSFGCQVAVELAVRHPDRVAALVLVARPWIRRPAPRPGRSSGGCGTRSGRTPCSCRSWSATSVTRDRTGRRHPGHALRDPIQDKLPQVKVPVLVTRGSRKPTVPLGWAQTATRLSSALASVELRGSGLGLLAALQSFGNLTPSAIAGFLWTLVSARRPSATSPGWL